MQIPQTWLINGHIFIQAKSKQRRKRKKKELKKRRSRKMKKMERLLKWSRKRKEGLERRTPLRNQEPISKKKQRIRSFISTIRESILSRICIRRCRITTWLLRESSMR